MCPPVDFLIAEHHSKQCLSVFATLAAYRLVLLFIEAFRHSDKFATPEAARLYFGHDYLLCLMIGSVRATGIEPV